MLRSILVGIEDSRSGIAAQELSFRWAERFDAHLTAITIVDGDNAEIPAKSVPLGAFVGSVGPAGRATIVQRLTMSSGTMRESLPSDAGRRVWNSS